MRRTGFQSVLSVWYKHQLWPSGRPRKSTHDVVDEAPQRADRPDHAKQGKVTELGGHLGVLVEDFIPGSMQSPLSEGFTQRGSEKTVSRRKELLLADPMQELLLLLEVVGVRRSLLCVRCRVMKFLLYRGDQLGLEIRQTDFEESAGDLVRQGVRDELRV